MAWFKVDDRLWSHPKWLETPATARGLWVTAGSFSAMYETNGFISTLGLKQIGHSIGQAERLVLSGLWLKVEGGYRFHDWIDFQPTSAELQAKREARAEAGRKGGLASGRSRREANASGLLEAKTNPVPSRPDPVTSNEVTTSPPTPSKRETRLSTKWQPTPEHMRRSNELGLDLLVEIEKFRNHAATHERRAKNWNAAFTNWLIRAGEYAARDRERGHRPTYQERQAEMWDREMAAAKARDEVMFGADQRANAHNPALLEGG